MKLGGMRTVGGNTEKKKFSKQQLFAAKDGMRVGDIREEQLREPSEKPCFSNSYLQRKMISKGQA